MTERWKLPVREVSKEDAPRPYRVLVHAVRPLMGLLTTRSWEGGEHIPETGGALVVCNHASNYDTLALGEFCIFHGRWPRFLGKSELWKVPVIRYFANGARQIPVERNTPNAKEALVHARRALADGDLVTMFPEGTITKDPDIWPMTGRRGAATLALTTDVPIIPVAIWGSHRVLGGAKLRFPELGKGKLPVALKAGPPMTFKDLRAQQTGEELPDKGVLDEATNRIMDTLTEMVEELRGEQAPAGRFDTRLGQRVVPENPHHS